MNLLNKILAASAITLGSCTSMESNSKFDPLADNSPNYILQTNEYLTKTENEILDNADKNRVMMFGEDHNNQKDDAFFKYMLPKLKEKGYARLGIELDRERDNGSLEDYISESSTQSEFLGNLQASLNYFGDNHIDIINKAKENNIDVFFYDSTPQKQKEIFSNEREVNSLKNIIDEGLLDDPNSKFLIYCGGIHIIEKSFKEDGEIKAKLGKLLNHYTEGKTYSIAIGDFFNSTEYSDIVVDLEKINFLNPVQP